MSLGDDSSLLVDNEQGAHSLVVTDSIDPLLEVGHFKFSVTIIKGRSPYILALQNQ